MSSKSCPRCSSNDVGKVADSPVPGKWKVYGCQACNYLWRSTEKLEGITKLTKEMKDNATIHWEKNKV